MSDWDRFLKNFARVLRQRRLSLGLSQQKLGEKVGFQRTYIADIERCARATTLKNAWKLALSLDVHLSVLISEAEGLSSQSKKERKPR